MNFRAVAIAGQAGTSWSTCSPANRPGDWNNDPSGRVDAVELDPLRSYRGVVQMRRLVSVLLPLLLLTACARQPIEVVGLDGGRLATMRPPEDIQSLHDPQLLTVEQAAGRLRNDERVLGVEIAGRAVAIALSSVYPRG
jgi:hypothetical protein